MSPTPPLKRVHVDSRPPPYSILSSSRLRGLVDECEGITNKNIHCVELERRLHKANYPPLDSPDLSWDGFPSKFKSLVLSNFVTHTTSLTTSQTSSDGSTTKLLVKLSDGHMVESVIMRHETGRTTLCVSSQVGCKMGCTFCATGTMGIIGDLTEGEILEQLVWANKELGFGGKEGGRKGGVRNIVFMGMGE
ncbi:hypothetical protein TrRE_jg1794, partial [Triparma retinervis]